MSHRDKEPAGLTILKIVGAVILVLVALAFGSVGACGAWITVAGFWETVTRRGTSFDNNVWVIGLICAVVGLSVAGLLAWAVRALLRKKEDRDE
jgi:hypothetical protein